MYNPTVASLSVSRLLQFCSLRSSTFYLYMYRVVFFNRIISCFKCFKLFHMHGGNWIKHTNSERTSLFPSSFSAVTRHFDSYIGFVCNSKLITYCSKISETIRRKQRSWRPNRDLKELSIVSFLVKRTLTEENTGCSRWLIKMIHDAYNESICTNYHLGFKRD